MSLIQLPLRTARGDGPLPMDEVDEQSDEVVDHLLNGTTVRNRWNARLADGAVKVLRFRSDDQDHRQTGNGRSYSHERRGFLISFILHGCDRWVCDGL